MATLTDKIKVADVSPKQDVSFQLSLGSTIDNEMAKSLRHSWESQNVDIHSQALFIVITALNNFKTDIKFNVSAFLKIMDNMIPMNTIETELKDFDILTNKNFDGLQIFRKSASINPKNFSGSPLLVNFRMYNINYDKYRLIHRVGFFFIRGEGDINYVQTEDASFSHITDFKVNQLCFKNLNDDTEQVLFER